MHAFPGTLLSLVAASSASGWGTVILVPRVVASWSPTSSMEDAWRMDYAIELSNMDVSKPHSACKMVMLQLFSSWSKANNYRMFSLFIGRLEAVATETIRDKTASEELQEPNNQHKHIIIEFCIFPFK